MQCNVECIFHPIFGWNGIICCTQIWAAHFVSLPVVKCWSWYIYLSKLLFFLQKIKHFSLCLYCFCAFFYDFLKFYLKPKLIIPKTIQYKLYVGTKKGLLQSKGKETVLNFSWIGLVGWPISGQTNLKFGWGSNGFEVHSWWMNLGSREFNVQLVRFEEVWNSTI